MLASLGQILVASLIVLIPTLDHVGVGAGLVLVTGWLLYQSMKSTLQIVPLVRRWRRDPVARTIVNRTAIGDLSMVTGLIGAAGVLVSYGPALSFVAADMVVRLALAVAGAWLLIVAVSEEPEVPGTR